MITTRSQTANQLDLTRMLAKYLPVRGEFTPYLMEIGQYIEARAKLNIRNNPSKGRAFGGSKEGLIDSGALLNSIKYRVIPNAKGGEVIIGSYGVPYAAIHEYGGVIKPRNAKYLTIPVQKWSKGRRASDFGRNLVAIGRVLYDKTKLPKKGNALPDSAKAFVLARKAVIPPRPYLSTAINDVRTQRKIESVIQRMMLESGE